ncbi:MAG: KH domain-containing protein [Patescibacteria group bacterium]
MIDLLTHITQGVTNNKDVQVSEDMVDGVHQYTIRAPKDVMGLLIGKEGRTIRAIRSLARARAIVEKININVNLEETTQ